MDSKKHLILSRQLAFESDYTLTPEHIDLIRIATFINFKELFITGDNGVITFDCLKTTTLCAIMYIANNICELNNIDINQIKGAVDVSLTNYAESTNTNFANNLMKSLLLLHNLRNCIRHKNFTINNRKIVINNDSKYEELRGIEVPIVLFDFLITQRLSKELYLEFLKGLSEINKKINGEKYDREQVISAVNNNESALKYDEYYYTEYNENKNLIKEYNLDNLPKFNNILLNVNSLNINLKFLNKELFYYGDYKIDDKHSSGINNNIELCDSIFKIPLSKKNDIKLLENLLSKRISANSRKEILDIFDRFISGMNLDESKHDYYELIKQIEELKKKRTEKEFRRATKNLIYLVRQILSNEALTEEIAFLDLYLLFITIDLQKASRSEMRYFDFSSVEVVNLSTDIQQANEKLKKGCKNKLYSSLNSERIKKCGSEEGLEKLTQDLFHFYYKVLLDGISKYNEEVFGIINNSTAHGHLKLDGDDVVFSDYVGSKSSGITKMVRIDKEKIDETLQSLDSTSDYKFTMNKLFEVLKKLFNDEELVNRIKDTFRNIYMAKYEEEPDFNKTFEELFGGVLKTIGMNKGLGEA